MNAFTVIAATGFVVYVAATWALVFFAYRTSPVLGTLSFFVPLFAISVGNHRIETPHARRLALIGWTGFAIFLLALILMPR